MFRRILVASVGAIALSGAALAADLTRPPPPVIYMPPAPPAFWTGFYLGGNAGGTWSSSNNINTVSSNGFANFNVPLPAPGGFIGGGQLGYNYQFNNSWVVGAEADIQGVAVSNDSTSIASGGFPNTILTATESRKLDYLGTVRGRLGFLITPTLLAYGTGGLAYGGVKGQTSITTFFPPTFINFDSTSGTFNTTRAGWTAGGGAEWMFPPYWSIKVEYLYFSLGSGTWSDGVLLTSPTTLSVLQSSTRFSGNIVRAGLNYHFNWLPAPIVANGSQGYYGSPWTYSR
jgi:outer membrane immunogenic protein